MKRALALSWRCLALFLLSQALLSGLGGDAGAASTPGVTSTPGGHTQPRWRPTHGSGCGCASASTGRLRGGARKRAKVESDSVEAVGEEGPELRPEALDEFSDVNLDTAEGLEHTMEMLDRDLPKMPTNDEIKTPIFAEKFPGDIPEEMLAEFEVDGAGAQEAEEILMGSDQNEEEDSGPRLDDSDRDLDEVDAETLGIKFLANEKERVSNAKSALFEAAQNGDWQAIRKAVNAGAPVNAHDHSNAHWTALHYAAAKGSMNTVQALILLGANVSEASEYGSTPLHVACEKEHEDIIETLINNGSDIEARNEGNYTPFLVAASRGQMQVIRLLIEEGGDIEDRTYCGNTALHLAATTGHEHIMLGLLEMGIPVNEQNNRNLTALHMAAHRDNGKVTQILMKEGADRSLQDVDGDTAIHYAARKGCLAALEEMVDKQIPHDILLLKNVKNQTALDMACKQGEGLCASLIWETLGRPGRKLHVDPKPLTLEEENDAFLKQLWQVYKLHRNETHLEGLSKADDIRLFLRAKRRIKGDVEKVIDEKDMFVIRKGVREYVTDKPKLKKMLMDREYNRDMKGMLEQ